MRIQGRLKGVSFYPVVEKTAKATKHKYGASASWSQCTDTYKPTLTGHGIDAEISAFKYNFELTALIAPLTDDLYADEIKKANQTGRIRFGSYFLGWAWKNPNTGNLETIPNWSGTTWLQGSANLGIIPQELVGTSKQAQFPFLGTELFQISNGKFGYNDATGEMGEIDVVTGSINDQREWFKTLIGRYPSTSSYSYGKRVLENLIKSKYLGTRGSSHSLSNYTYDFSRETALYQQLTTYHNTMVTSIGRERADADSKTALVNTIANGGWYRDFSHWHWAVDTEWEDYFRNQREAIGTNDVVTLDFGTAYEHHFLRKMVRRCGLFTDGSDLVLVTDTKDNDNLPLDVIETPLSIEIDLTETIFDGKDIEGIGDKGIRKLGDNKFIIEVPYTKRDGFQAVRLLQTNSPAYMDFTLPSIQSVNKNGSTLNVTTDKPTNIVIFSVPTNGRLYEASVLRRSNTMSQSHEIYVEGIDITNQDIYIGAITKERQSILSNKYNF